MKRLLKHTFVLLSAVVILLILLLQLSFKEVLELLMKIPPSTYVLILFLYTFDWILRGVRWKMILAANGTTIPLHSSTLISLFGNYANFLVPFRIGDLAWMYAARKLFDVPLATSIISVLIDRLYDLFTILLLFLLAGMFLSKELLPLPPSILYGFVITFLMLTYLCYKLFLHRNIMKKILRKESVYTTYEHVRLVLIRAVSNKRVLLPAILISSLIWILEASIPFLLLIAIGFTTPFFFVLVAVLAANLIKTTGITPGGIGTYEATIAATLILLTALPHEIAITIAILDHLLKKLYILVIGSITVNRYGLELFGGIWKRLSAEKRATIKEEVL